jgi:hypothetical protein
MTKRVVTRIALIALCMWSSCACAALVFGWAFPGRALYFIASLDGKFKVYAIDLPLSLTHKLSDQEMRAPHWCCRQMVNIFFMWQRRET